MMTLPPSPAHQQFADEKTLQLSTSSSDCGQEPKSLRSYSNSLESSPEQTKSQYCETETSDSPRRKVSAHYEEVLAELLRNHDIRDSFKTKNLERGGQAGRNEQPDFKEIMRRMRKGRTYFLLMEYPEVLFMSRQGRGSGLFN